MANIQLAGQVREELKKRAAMLREEGIVPGVVYGGKENINVKVPANVFDKVYEEAGENSIVDLVLDEKTTIPVIVYDIQRHPMTMEITHIDFYEIDMKKEITTKVPLEYVGEAPAVKLGGTLLQNLDEIEISCLPKDLMHEITVDVSTLETFEDSIHVSDLQLNEGVTLETPEQVLVARVEEKIEVEEEEISEEEAVAAVAGEGEEEGEEGEGKEGSEEKSEAKEESKEG